MQEDKIINERISGGATAPLVAPQKIFIFIFIFSYQWDLWQKKKNLFLILILKYSEKLSLKLCQILQLNV